MSDHFNGKRFFNTGPYTKKSLWDLIKWGITRNRGPWPRTRMKHPEIKPPVVTGEQNVNICYINHASILISTKHINILTDPIWSERASPFSFVGPKRIQDPGIRFSDLPRIDIVLISHNHYDHLDIPTLKQLHNKFNPLFIVPLANKKILQKHGIQKIQELDWWQEKAIEDSVITLLPSQHWSSRTLFDRFKSLWGAYGILVNRKRIYFAGDTGYGKHFSEVYQHWGKPEVACLPIGAYEPRWFMHDNHMTPEEAVLAHLDLHASYSIAIHFGFWQLGDDGFEQPVIDLAHAIEKYEIDKNKFMVLPPGNHFTV